MATKKPQEKSPVPESPNILGFAIGGQHVGSVPRRGYSAQASYFNTDPGISVRPPMTREAYEYFRPNERVPIATTQESYRTIMVLCRMAYERVGVIRSVVDMMSEFGADGIEVIHPDEGPNNFYKAWQKRVRLTDRTERFLSWFYKSGNVVIRRKFGKIPNRDMNKVQKILTNVGDTPGTGRIPLDYTFYDPATIELVGGSIGAISPKKIYALRVPLTFFDGIRNPRNELEQEVYDAMPPEIQDAIQGKTSNGLYYMPIPEDKIHVAYYKKDDSDIWGKSFIYSILDDVFYNDKLKLAKTAGLDGWANVIRLWTLGDHTTPVPVKADPDAGSKLASILEQNTGGGSADIIWDSAIKLQEFYPPLDKLVNFTENLDSILLGLGVPDNLVGGTTKSGSSSSINWLGLKNLIKRLETGRRAVTEWLEAEIDIIQKEMGFRNRPIIRFSNSDLHDEATYFQLLVSLIDRNVISDQTVLERINEFPEIEAVRIQQEKAMKEQGTMPEKASPFHKPDLQQQQQHEMDKIKLQTKLSQDNSGGSGNNSSNIQKEHRVPKKSENGRPSGSKDTTKRSRTPNKKIKASSFDELFIEGAKVYDRVDAFIKEHALTVYNVSNIRQLTSAQDDELDKIRATLMIHIEPFSELNNENFAKAAEIKDGPLEEFNQYYQDSLNNIGLEKITNDQKKLLRIKAYANAWCDLQD